MKKGIHPQYYHNAKVRCVCGNVFEIGSTKKHIETEICFKCHPFYTGKEKIIDSAGRVEKFQKKLQKKEELSKKTSKRK
ncbi:50S ribosomal protein L31 [bacterium]|nr:50S ribosomal protein L31 [bacterium]